MDTIKQAEDSVKTTVEQDLTKARELLDTLGSKLSLEEKDLVSDFHSLINGIENKYTELKSQL